MKVRVYFSNRDVVGKVLDVRRIILRTAIDAIVEIKTGEQFDTVDNFILMEESSISRDLRTGYWTIIPA